MARNPQQFGQLIRYVATRADGSLAWRRLAVVAGLFIIYLALQPWLVRSFGLPLPGFADSLPEDRPTAVARDGPSTSRADRQATEAETSGTDDPAEDSEQAEFLRTVSRDVYESPAGLRYTPGSLHRHRLKHVMAHARDAPNRTGKHGVFDDDDEVEVLTLIDQAYHQALAGDRTNTKHEGRRTVHTVDLGRRIGYIGGQSGKRNGHPPARHMRLVLQDKDVITAFPVEP